MDDGWKVEPAPRNTTRGHWKGNFSIYESIATGQCVLSSGAPNYVGPIHIDTLAEAKTLAQLKETTK